MIVGRYLRSVLAVALLGLTLSFAIEGTPRASAASTEVARRSLSDTHRCITGYFLSSGTPTGVFKCYVDMSALTDAKRVALLGSTVVHTNDGRRSATPLSYYHTGSTNPSGNPLCYTATHYWGPQTVAGLGDIPSGAVVGVCSGTQYPGGTYRSGVIAYGVSPSGTRLFPVCPTAFTNSQCDSATGTPTRTANPVGSYLGWDGGAHYTSAGDWLRRSVELPERYPGTTAFPSSACQTLTMFIAEPGRTIAVGGTLNATFTSGWPAVMASSTVQLRYRWAPGDAWTKFYDATTGGGLIPSTQTFTNRTSGPRAGVTLEVHCTNDGNTYVRGDNSPGVDDPQPARPCTGLTLAWMDEGIYSAGETVWLTATIAAGAGNVTGLLINQGRFGNTQTYTVDEVIPSSSITWLAPGGVPASFPIGAGEYKVGFDLEDEWTTDDGIYVRCQDATGYLNFQYKAPAAVGKVPLPEGYDDRFNDCLDGVDFGWRPSAWVPAFFRTTGCVAQVLFVPIESDLEAMTGEAEAVAERAPISYIVAVGGEMSGMLSGAPAAVDAGRNGCLTVLGPMDEIGLEAQTACPSTLDGANITTARSIMGAGSWVLIGLGFFGATRRLIS